MHPYEPVLAVLNVPENRIKYANQFANQHEHTDRKMYSLAVYRMMEYIGRCDDAECHF